MLCNLGVIEACTTFLTSKLATKGTRSCSWAFDHITTNFQCSLLGQRLLRPIQKQLCADVPFRPIPESLSWPTGRLCLQFPRAWTLEAPAAEHRHRRAVSTCPTPSHLLTSKAIPSGQLTEPGSGTDKNQSNAAKK